MLTIHFILYIILYTTHTLYIKVMSLRCPVGNEGNLLDISDKHCARMIVNHPILTLEEIQSLKDSTYRYV